MTLSTFVTDCNTLTTAINAADVEAADLRDQDGETGLWEASVNLLTALTNLVHLAGGCPRLQTPVKPVDAPPAV